MDTNMKELNMNEMEQAGGGSMIIAAGIFAGVLTVGACIYATVDGYLDEKKKKKNGGAAGSW